MSSADIFEGIDLLCQICDVASVDATVVRNALSSSFTDFEQSEIPVYNPSQFLALMEEELN